MHHHDDVRRDHTGPDHAPATSLRVAAAKCSPLAARGVNGRKMLQPFLKGSTRKRRAAVADDIRACILEGRTTADIVRELLTTRANP